MKTIKYNGAVIRETPARTWQAEINQGHRRTRKNFTDLDRAKVWVEESALATHREAQRSTFDMRDAMRAITLLPEGVTLEAAARHYASSIRHVKAITMEAAIDEYQSERAHAGLRQRTMYSVKSQIRPLRDRFAMRDVSTVETKELISLMDELKATGGTRVNYRNTWGAFFKWAVQREYRDTNPCSGIIVQGKQEIGLPKILTINELQRLLRAATSDPPTLARITIASFAGLRTAEIMRTSMTDISKGQIHITSAASKVRQQRWVTIPPVLQAWLDICALPPGLICPYIQSSSDRHLEHVWARAGFTTWPRNGLRHSFGSYHLALHRSADLTAHEMGHRSTQMLYAHYRNVVTQADGEAWFAQFPHLVCPEFRP
jgi:hypothetical protein